MESTSVTPIGRRTFVKLAAAGCFGLASSHGWGRAFSVIKRHNDDALLDVGMTLLSAENLRTGNLWKWFMANPEPRHAMKLAGIEKS